jgi:hypothetical protein
MEDDKAGRSNPGGLFIPAGILLGLGAGFLFSNIPAGLFIGMGAGFVLMALTMFIRK